MTMTRDRFRGTGGRKGAGTTTGTFFLLLAWLLPGAASVTLAHAPLWQTLPHFPPMPAPESSGFVRVNGARLYYAIFNEAGGRPVILIHGALGSSDDWGFETPLLDKTHEVIVLDCRGRGRSTMSSRPLSYELMMSDVLGIMDYLKIGRASIVGWSDGGIIGLYMAIHHPERMDKLLAFGANYSVSRYPPPHLDPGMMPLGRRYLASMKERYRRLSPDPEAFDDVLQALDRMGATEPELQPAELARIGAPTVIADGQYEQFITRAETTALARLIPHAKLVIMPNVSHAGPVQDPQGFHHIVTDLLDGVAASAPSRLQ